MGGFGSRFTKESDHICDRIDASNSDWVTAHASASGFSIIEIERLWMRFQTLGSNQKGILEQEMLSRNSHHHSFFIQNILNSLSLDNGEIHFLTFIKIMKWAETSPLEEKCRAIFHFINSGESLHKDTFIHFLSKIYPGFSQQSILEYSESFFKMIDKSQKGYISETDFIDWFMSMDNEELSSIFFFEVIPTEIKSKADKLFSTYSKAPTSPSTPLDLDIPSDALLAKLADKIYRRDWQLLANQLGYNSDEIIIYDVPGKMSEKLKEMLLDWKTREGTEATCKNLEIALRQSNMVDIATSLW